jgi:hypothetical protein
VNNKFIKPENKVWAIYCPSMDSSTSPELAYKYLGKLTADEIGRIGEDIADSICSLNSWSTFEAYRAEIDYHVYCYNNRMEAIQ